MASSIGSADIKLKISPTRPSGLPPIYQMRDPHPKRSCRPGAEGRTLYFLQDISPTGMTKALQVEVDTPIPYGSEVDAMSAGFLALGDGDHVFSRPFDGRSSGEDDILVICVFGGRILSQDLKDELDRILEVIFGPRSTRDIPSGSTAFERSKPSRVLGNRCYTFGTSYEAPKVLSAPCADGRVSKLSDDVLKMRRDLLKITAQIAVNNMAYAPPEIIEHLTVHADLVNMPMIGTAGNVAFPSNQLNIAEIQSADHAGSMADDLGQFGEKHRDEKDSPAFFTHVTTTGNPEAHYDMGRFFIVYPGVFVTLKTHTSFLFSGLRQHGSTPVIAPANVSIDNLKYRGRVSLVSYATRGSCSSQQRFALAAIPNGKKKNMLLTLPPEFNAESTSSLACGHATFANDGHIILDPEAHMQFMARSILNMTLGIMRQLHPSVGAQVNSDAFLSAFSYRGPHDHARRSLSPWVNGPGWRPSTQASLHPAQPAAIDLYSHSTPVPLISQQDTVMPAARARWESFVKTYSAHIPWLGANREQVKFPSPHTNAPNQGEKRKGGQDDSERPPKRKAATQMAIGGKDWYSVVYPP